MSLCGAGRTAGLARRWSRNGRDLSGSQNQTATNASVSPWHDTQGCCAGVLGGATKSRIGLGVTFQEDM